MPAPSSIGSPSSGASVGVVASRVPHRSEALVRAFVEGHPLARAYHDPLFLRVLRRGAGLACETFAARREGSGELIGILPVALTQSLLLGTYATSLPHVNYGGALVSDEAALRPLLRAAWAWARARGARHLILRQTGDRPLPGLAATHGKETLLLPIPGGGPDALFKVIGSKTRNLVRKAEKGGFTVETDGPGALTAFHDAYAEGMRDLGTPSLPRSFFHALREEAGAAVELHIARSAEGRVAGAALSLRFRDAVEVPWASTRRRYKSSAANMLLYWHMMRRAALQGARVFDFGRSTPGSGPYQFKLQWGARPEGLPWYFMAPGGRAPTGDLAPTNPKFALAIRAWKRLPLGVARALGGHLALVLP